jgi:PPOX class probable F420-dependent enzyme
VSPFQIETDTPFGARVEQRLRSEVVIWLVTVSPSGVPEPSPVWFDWDGQSFIIYSRADTPRQRNLEANPRVALHFDGNGRGGDIVVFSGQAEVDDSLPPAHGHARYAAKYAEHFRRIGLTPEQFSAAYPLKLRIRPTRLRGH